MNELELFVRARQGDKDAKEKIVSDNLGLVWSIARRFMGRGYDLEEIYQVGCIGLLKAIDRFEENYEVKFSTYAVPLISGEIKRFLRDNGMIKVSRILKQNGYHISKARESLYIKLGREATISELAEETGLTDEEIVLATEANREVESIYQPVYGSEEGEVCVIDKLCEKETAGDTVEKTMNKIMLEQAMETLKEKERKLINMRYFEDKTQSEVAATLGISQVQVSRLEKKLLISMRKNIDNKSN